MFQFLKQAKRVHLFSCEKSLILNFSEISPSRGYPEAGMSFGDSKAVFKQRAMAMGMEEAGINTMATFAFSCNYMLQVPALTCLWWRS